MEELKESDIAFEIKILLNAMEKDISESCFRNYKPHLNKYNNFAKQLSSMDGFSDIYCIPDVPNRNKGNKNTKSSAEAAKLREVAEKCRSLLSRISRRKNSGGKMNTVTNERIVFIFGVIFVISLLVLAIFFPEPTEFQYTVFRIVLALASAGVAALIPGFIKVKFRNWLRAGGAIAVFVIVYFFSPASLQGVPETNHNGDIQVNVPSNNT